MNSLDFCYWLKGYISANKDKFNLMAEYMDHVEYKLDQALHGGQLTFDLETPSGLADHINFRDNYKKEDPLEEDC